MHARSPSSSQDVKPARLSHPRPAAFLCGGRLSIFAPSTIPSFSPRLPGPLSQFVAPTFPRQHPLNVGLHRLLPRRTHARLRSHRSVRRRAPNPCFSPPTAPRSRRPPLRRSHRSDDIPKHAGRRLRSAPFTVRFPPLFSRFLRSLRPYHQLGRQSCPSSLATLACSHPSPPTIPQSSDPLPYRLVFPLLRLRRGNPRRKKGG